MSDPAGNAARRDDSWRVRVYGIDGRPQGAGVLLPDNRILTCAHVVSSALAVTDDRLPPLATVEIDFPGSQAGRAYRSVVIDDGWFPPDPDGRGDLAVLALLDQLPSDVVPAQISAWRTAAPAAVTVFGHPDPLDDGVWATARPLGPGGPGGEWVQIDGVTVPGQRIVSGFSGAGVIDQETGVVVGLVVAEHQLAAAKIAWMLPVEVALVYWAPLARHVRPAAAGPAGVVGPPEVRTPLHRRDRQRLFDLVDRLPGIHNPANLDLILRELEDEWSQWRVDLNSVRAMDPPMEIWELLRRCLPVPDGVRLLADVLRSFYRDTVEMYELDRLVEELFPDPLLNDADRAALHEFLRGTDRRQIAAAYRYAVGGSAGDQLTDLDDIHRIADQLESMVRPPEQGLPPLLMFVDYLAHLRMHGGSVGQSVEMHVWLDSVGHSLGNSVPLRDLCARTVRSQTESRRYRVLLELRPDRLDPRRVLPAGWLYRDGGDLMPVLRRSDLARDLADVPSELERILLTVPDLADGEVDQLTIEVLVPASLLNHPVEEWELSTFPRTLGIRYPVVVRSLDRLSNTDSHAHWRRKWEWLSDHPGTGRPDSIYWHPETPDRSSESVYVELVRLDHLVCLAVPFPPDSVPDADHDPFTAAISAGMPAIFWTRDPRRRHQFKPQIHPFLAGRAIDELPTLALTLRREARLNETDDQHPGRYLGLLWDDPHHVPPRPVRLRAPGPQ